MQTKIVRIANWNPATPGGEARRAYSLANNTNWNGDLEFFITLRPDGAFSTYLDTA